MSQPEPPSLAKEVAIWLRQGRNGVKIVEIVSALGFPEGEIRAEIERQKRFNWARWYEAFRDKCLIDKQFLTVKCHVAFLIAFLGQFLLVYVWVAYEPALESSLVHASLENMQKLQVVTRGTKESCEVTMKNGEIWTYRNQYPHYATVRDLLIGKDPEIVLFADPDASTRPIDGEIIRGIKKVERGPATVASYADFLEYKRKDRLWLPVLLIGCVAGWLMLGLGIYETRRSMS
jgi:hypothetical protein